MILVCRKTEVTAENRICLLYTSHFPLDVVLVRQLPGLYPPVKKIREDPVLQNQLHQLQLAFLVAHLVNLLPQRRQAYQLILRAFLE